MERKGHMTHMIFLRSINYIFTPIMDNIVEISL